MPSPQRPVAAQYVATFLKPEMLHIYRQIRALSAWRPVVFCQKREHEKEFPWQGTMIVPKPRTHQFRRFYYKTILHEPIVAYPGEARRIWQGIDAADAGLLHIYFGHIAAYLRPMFPYCLLPVVVSFHGADTAVNLEKKGHAEAQREVFAKATLLLARSQSLMEQLANLGAPRESCDSSELGFRSANSIFPPAMRRKTARGIVYRLAGSLEKRGCAQPSQPLPALPGATRERCSPSRARVRSG
jgi:colanic acid/amylovoran biosynthesis glycosyltransferase